jgi:hypothetical protein
MLCAGILASTALVYFQHRGRIKTTPLRGPPNPSFLFGIVAALEDQEAAAVAYEKWAQEYGSVFMTSAALGKVLSSQHRQIIIY